MNESEWMVCRDPGRMLEWVPSAVRGVTYDQPTVEKGTRLAGDRKLRLYACACARQLWHLLVDDRSKRAVEVVERHADGEATRGQLRDAWRLSQVGIQDVLDKGPIEYAFRGVWFLADYWPASSAPRLPLEQFQKAGQAYAFQADLAREVFGNPFQPLPYLTRTVECDRCNGKGCRTFGTPCGACEGSGRRKGNADWLTPQALVLAEAAYRERDRPCPYCKDATQLYDGSQWPGLEKRCACKGTRRVPREDGSLDPVALAVLADCLEEASCTDVWVLRHLRGEERCPLYYAPSGGPGDCATCGAPRSIDHGWVRKPAPCVRGCHVVDCLLGRG